MENLTKDLLLRYALHPNTEISEVYQQKLCDELLKKGMVLIEDIHFDCENGFNSGAFFAQLTNQVMDYCQTSRVWDTYFEIADKMKNQTYLVVHSIVDLCRSDIQPATEERCHQWLREFPKTEWEDGLLQDLLVSFPFNEKLEQIALERFKQLDDVSGFILHGGLDLIKSYPLLCNFIKVAIAKKQPKVCSYLLAYSLERLNPEMQCQGCEKPSKISAIIVDSITSSQDLCIGECYQLSNLYLKGYFDAKTYLKIADKLTSLADQDNQNYLGGLIEGLTQAATEHPETLPRVTKIIKRQLRLLFNNDQIFQILRHLTIIARHYQEKENFATEIFPPLKKIFLSHVNAMEHMIIKSFRLYKSWVEMDKSILLELVDRLPQCCSFTLIQFVSVKYSEIWDEFFAKITISERNALPIICELIEAYPNVEEEDVREKVSCKIDELLKEFCFDEDNILFIKERLQDVNGLEHLNLTILKQNAEQIKNVLSLLD